MSTKNAAAASPEPMPEPDPRSELGTSKVLTRTQPFLVPIETTGPETEEWALA